MNNARRLAHDWFDGVLPANVEVADTAFIETTYGLTRFDSHQCPGLVMGEGSGLYSTTLLDVGVEGRVSVGPYSCLNAPYVVCSRSITIGSHCLISWGVVITDTDFGPGIAPRTQREALHEVAASEDRRLRALAPPRPVVIEDVVWIGFESVIMPGVTVGRGSVVGCRTVVDRDVPPGAVVAGNPFRIIRFVDVPDDHEVMARQ